VSSDIDAVHARRAGAAAPVEVSEELRKPVAKTLSLAFKDDPVLGWFIRDDEGRDLVRDAMIGRMVAGYMKTGWAIAAPDAACVALWAKPGHRAKKASLIDQLKMIPQLRQMTGSLFRIPRVLEVMSAMDTHHPKEPDHYYLHMIGVHPEFHGQGLGSTILATALEHVDGEGMPAYLENSNPRNMPLYERHGFKVIGEMSFGGGKGPKMWPMWRDAQ